MPTTLLPTTHQIRRSRKLAWAEYQAEARLRIEAFDGFWRNQIVDYIKSHTSDEHWDLIAGYYEFAEWDNVLFDVLQRTVRIYNRSVRRRFVSRDGSEDPLLTDLLINSTIDKDMNKATMYSLSCGLSAIRPYFNSSYELLFQIKTPETFSIITSYNDPSVIVGLHYTDFQSHHHTNKMGRYFIWDMEGIVIARKLGHDVSESPDKAERESIRHQFAGVIEYTTDSSDKFDGLAESHIGLDGSEGSYAYIDDFGLPVLPFTFLAPDRPSDSPYNPNVGRDLWTAALSNAYTSTRKAWVHVNQSHKQLLVTGTGLSDVPQSISDPAIPMVIPRDGGEVKVDSLDLTSDPSHLERSNATILEVLLRQRGMSLNNFVKSASPQSADALEIQSRGDFQYDSKLITSLAKPAEINILKTIKVLWKHDGDPQRSFQPDSVAVVDFQQYISRNIIGKIKEFVIALEHGLVNVGDLVAAINENIMTTTEGNEAAVLNREGFLKLMASVIEESKQEQSA